MNQFTAYTPRDGDTIHLRFERLPERTGRYVLGIHRDGARASLTRCATNRKTFVDIERLIELYDAGTLTPIDAVQLERDAQMRLRFTSNTKEA